MKNNNHFNIKLAEFKLLFRIQYAFISNTLFDQNRKLKS